MKTILTQNIHIIYILYSRIIRNIIRANISCLNLQQTTRVYDMLSINSNLRGILIKVDFQKNQVSLMGINERSIKKLSHLSNFIRFDI